MTAHSAKGAGEEKAPAVTRVPKTLTLKRAAAPPLRMKDPELVSTGKLMRTLKLKQNGVMKMRMRMSTRVALLCPLWNYNATTEENASSSHLSSHIL